MSLAPYLPPTSGDATAVLALLQVISEPKAAKAVLDKMVEHKKAIDDATEKQRQLLADGEKERSKELAAINHAKMDADANLSKATSELGAAKATLATIERKQAAVDAAEKRMAETGAELDEREQKIQQREKELAARSKALVEHSEQLTKASDTLTRREQEINHREKLLADDIAENQKWLAGLKPPRSR